MIVVKVYRNLEVRKELVQDYVGISPRELFLVDSELESIYTAVFVKNENPQDDIKLETKYYTRQDLYLPLAKSNMDRKVREVLSGLGNPPDIE